MTRPSRRPTSWSSVPDVSARARDRNAVAHARSSQLEQVAHEPIHSPGAVLHLTDQTQMRIVQIAEIKKELRRRHDRADRAAKIVPKHREEAVARLAHAARVRRDRLGDRLVNRLVETREILEIFARSPRVVRASTNGARWRGARETPTPSARR